MKVIEKIKNRVSNLNYKPVIFYAEGWNKNIQNAAIEIQKTNLIEPVLIFKTSNELKEFNNELNIKTVVVENTDLSEYATLLYEIRKAKGMDLATANKLVKEPNYLAALLVKQTKNSGAICGIEYTTKDTLRAALQVVRAKPKNIVNSIMIMEKENQTIFLADIGLVINPTAEELANIIYNCLQFITQTLDIHNNNAALLSYSSEKSGAGESVDKVRKAYEIYLNNYRQFECCQVYGEIQFDAAVVEEIRNKKCKNSTLTNNANIFIFPNLDAGNISYKILQRYANFKPTGPIIVGLNKPINDLSRGAGIDEVISLSYVTALQTSENN